MNRRVGFLIALALLIAILALARNQVAWANQPSEQGVLVGDNEVQPVVALHDDHDHHDDHDGHGTVKPPPKLVIIKETGKYSVGGLCTLNVQLKNKDIKAVAYLEPLWMRSLPKGVKAVSQGCHLTFYKSYHPLDTLTSKLGTSKVCFAAVPKKTMTIYFYDTNSRHPGWVALQTKVDKGVACANANGSGTYIATYQKP